VGARRPRNEGCVEIHVKTLIQLQVIFRDSYYVDVVISFQVNLAEFVLVEEVVGNDRPLVVIGKRNRMRARIPAQADNPCLERMFRVAHIAMGNTVLYPRVYRLKSDPKFHAALMFLERAYRHKGMSDQAIKARLAAASPEEEH
jgi:hypothetical protein